MKKVLKYLLNFIFYIIILWLKIAIAVGISMIFYNGRLEANPIIGILGLVSIFTSYKLVKRIQKFQFIQNMFGEKITNQTQQDYKVIKKVNNKIQNSKTNIRMNLFKKIRLIKLNIYQKTFLFGTILNLALHPVYGSLWLGQSKTYTTGGYRSRRSRDGYDAPVEVHHTINKYTDEELFLWIGITIVFLIGIFLFKTREKN
jgi:xanthosine utilization system XapX-like protein